VLCFRTDGCGPALPGSEGGAGNAMYRWLKHDLATHPDSEYGCTLAYWHHPLVSVSTGSGRSPEVKPLWDLLYAAHADVVLNAHSHNYQRWQPMDPDAQADPEHGIREFIIGTGGSRKDPLVAGPWPTTVAVAQDTTFGVLELGLRHAGFTWRWVSAADQPEFSDERTTPVACH